MLRNERRVVITGLGLVTPLGIGTATVWDALNHSRGAVGPIKSFPVDGLPNNIAAEVPGLDNKSMTEMALPRIKKKLRQSLKYMARDIQWLLQVHNSPFLMLGLKGQGSTQHGLALISGLV